MRALAAACLTVAMASLLGAAAADADPRRGDREAALGWVTAESRFGHGDVSGPVRIGPRGAREVRMPGGTWIECRQGCADTLRRETVDFWENRTNPNVRDGAGYLDFRF